jgi:hypothetical protein
MVPEGSLGATQFHSTLPGGAAEALREGSREHFPHTRACASLADQPPFVVVRKPLAS